MQSQGRSAVFRSIRLAACTLACSIAATSIAADNGKANAKPGKADSRSSAQVCAAKLQGLYGFHCHGSAFNGVVFGPVTFVGIVEGKGNGIYDGHGTLSSSSGSILTHFAGPATFGANCLGHVDYTTNDIVQPDGTVVAHLPPASFDFIGVDGGKEILGAGVAPPGVTGDQVPRLACRLVRVR